MKTPSRPAPNEPSDISALRALRARQPELASAVDLQIEIVTMQRRVEARLSTPWIEIDQAEAVERLASGRPLVRVADIGFEWMELRLLCRQVADLLRRFDMLEPEPYDQIHRHLRAGRPDETDVAAWYGAGDREPPTTPPAGDVLDGDFAQVMEIAARPFLARMVAATAGRVDLSGWRRTSCPFCGGSPELAVIRPSAEGLLACGRCTGNWPSDTSRCIHCGNANASSLGSFISRDGSYRLTTCDVCRRYFKAYDVVQGGRPLMLTVDSIATLPLDAVAQQRGYRP